MKNSILVILASLLLTSCALVTKPTYLQQVNKLVNQENKVGGIVRLSDIEGRFICSGFVVNNSTVITASHCGEAVFVSGVNFVNITNGKETVSASFVSGNGRLDLAAIKGDFTKFSKLSVATDPEEDSLANKDTVNLVTCGYPYGGKPVCFKLTDLEKYVDFTAAKGQMNAGMSGGPVIDLNSGKVMGVNVGVAEGFVFFSPTLNIFNALGLVK